MAANEPITKEEFIERFKLSYSLAVKDERVMQSYESYCQVVSRIRSDAVAYLKGIGVHGDLRSLYNDSIQRLSETSHRKYLFHKDPTCGICGFLIDKIEDATIDHVHPRAHGGPNALENKQIAHGKCNVLKSDKIGFTIKKVVL
jgi:hypothetical protein